MRTKGCGASSSTAHRPSVQHMHGGIPIVAALESAYLLAFRVALASRVGTVAPIVGTADDTNTPSGTTCS